jgi:hypothetical protein
VSWAKGNLGLITVFLFGDLIMIFTKYLESLREPKVKHNHPHNYSVFSGQASAEYIILMVVLIGLLAGWLGGLFSGLQDSLRTNFYDPAVEAIISDSGDGGDGGDGGDDGDDGDHGDDGPLPI